MHTRVEYIYMCIRTKSHNNYFSSFFRGEWRREGRARAPCVAVENKSFVPSIYYYYFLSEGFLFYFVVFVFSPFRRR